MRKHKRGSTPPTQNAIDAALLKARKVFSQSYEETGKVSALMAQHLFCQSIEYGVISLSDAHRLMNSETEIRGILKEAEKAFLESEQGRISQIYKNTTFKSAITAGLISGTVVSAFFYFLPMFQPQKPEEKLKDAANEVGTPKQTPQPASLTFNTYNLNCPNGAQAKPPQVQKKKTAAASPQR